MAIACGSATDGGSSFTTRDSGGVTLAENAAAAVERGGRWTVVEDPLLDIGTMEGDTLRELFGTTEAVRLDDGGVAVLTSRGTEIRFFGPEGAFRRETGRQGEGPGEFGGAAGFWRYRTNSLLVWDGRFQRVMVLDQTGALGRVTDVEIPSYNPRLLGPIADGSWVVRAHLFTRPEEGIRTQRSLLFHHRPDGTMADTVGAYPNLRSVPPRGQAGGHRPCPAPLLRLRDRA